MPSSTPLFVASMNESTKPTNAFLFIVCMMPLMFFMVLAASIPIPLSCTIASVALIPPRDKPSVNPAPTFVSSFNSLPSPTNESISMPPYSTIDADMPLIAELIAPYAETKIASPIAAPLLKPSNEAVAWSAAFDNCPADGPATSLPGAFPLGASFADFLNSLPKSSVALCNSSCCFLASL